MNSLIHNVKHRLRVPILWSAEETSDSHEGQPHFQLTLFIKRSLPNRLLKIEITSSPSPPWLGMQQTILAPLGSRRGCNSAHQPWPHSYSREPSLNSILGSGKAVASSVGNMSMPCPGSQRSRCLHRFNKNCPLKGTWVTRSCPITCLPEVMVLTTCEYSKVQLRVRSSFMCRYLQLGCRINSSLIERNRICLVWAIMRLYHPLLASTTRMHSYDDVRFG